MERLQDHITDDYTNRVANAIYLYAEQEAQFAISNPVNSRNDLQAAELKLQYYNSIYKASKKPNPYEKLTLRFVRHEIAKMQAKLNPTSVNKILYSKAANAVRNFINGNNLYYKKHNHSIANIQREIIQAYNLEALTSSMKKAGFTFAIDGTLQKMINQDLPQFHVRYADVHNRNADFVLHFKKIPRTDLYYFEKFDAVSRPTLEALLDNHPSCIRQTFIVNGKTTFTAKEATNLVNGKAVCKTIDGKESWLSLDTAKMNQQSTFRYLSFDLEKAVQKLPIKQLENLVHRKALLDALKTGSQKEITMILDGQQVKYTIEAAPMRKTIDVMDKEYRLVDISKLLNNNSQGLTRKLVEKISQDDDVIDLGQQQKRNKKAI